MLTTPSTIWTMNEYKTSGADVHWVVKLTDGTSTWYFGDTMMEITEGFVYPMLRPSFSISEQFDPFTRRWSIGQVTLTLKNAQFKRDATTSDAVRVSDVIGDILGNDVYLYAFAGSGKRITQISDGLLRFVGKTIDRMKYDDESVTIVVHDKGKLIHKMLPSELISSVWASAPIETINEKIPLVYGTFTLVGSDTALFDRTGNGLARATRVDLAWPTKHVVADHIITAFTTFALETGDKYPHPPFPYYDAYDEDDSGRATVTLEPNALLYLKISNHTDTYETYIVDVTLAYDASLTTRAKVYDYQDVTGPPAALTGLAVYWLEKPLPNNSSGITYKIRVDKGDAAGVTTLRVYMYDIESSADVGTYTAFTLNSSATNHSGAQSGAFAGATGLRFSAIGDQATDGDDVTNNLHMLSIYNAKIEVTFDWEQEASDIWHSFIGLTGRKYGTWIDDHSASAYVSTNLIEDPAGIIESLLIDELGLTTASIDMPSFDAAENSSVVARLNLHSGNQKTSDEIIRKLCEQSTFAFVFSAVGKATLIPLNDGSPTTNLTIPLSWIKDGKIEVGKTANIINKLTVNSRYQQEYNNTYADTDEYNDATSQAAYGTFGYTANWENIAGTSAAHVAEHLVYASTGLWSNEHVEISFEMVGLTGARLELKDWIELDDESCDGRLLCYGASWSGKQFKITKLTQTPYGTKVTAIEL